MMPPEHCPPSLPSWAELPAPPYGAESSLVRSVFFRFDLDEGLLAGAGAARDGSRLSGAAAAVTLFSLASWSSLRC